MKNLNQPDPKVRTGATKIEIIMYPTKSFDAANPSFWVSIITSIFGVIALLGVQLPLPADQLAGQAITVFTTSGSWALIGWAVSSLGGIAIVLFQKAKAKELNFAGLFGNVNFLLLLASLTTSLFLRFGLVLPVNALGDLVQQIYAGSYTGIAAVLFGQILNPVIRFIQSKRTSVPA